MAVAPSRLQRVTADDIKTVELKAFRGIAHGGSDDAAENVRFATAGSARTGATKNLQV